MEQRSRLGKSTYHLDWQSNCEAISVAGKESMDSAAALIDKMNNEEGNEYVDNFRYALVDDTEAMKKYIKQRRDGCCGFIDILITFEDGKKAFAGCNFGH